MMGVEYCIASVYNSHESQWGARTASGIKLKDNALTVAHKTYKLLGMLRVTSLQSGLSVVLQVIDRGPYVRGRCVDLTEGAAKALKIDGLGRVKVEPWSD